MRIVLKAKITIPITGAKLHYEGSLTLDEDIMDKIGIQPFEQVFINGKNKKERIMTYIIPGKRGTKICEANGGASHYFKKGDIVHLLFFEMTNKNIEPIIL